jgi:hypothetical protein
VTPRGIDDIDRDVIVDPLVDDGVRRPGLSELVDVDGPAETLRM